jgi:hypothetical protein
MSKHFCLTLLWLSSALLVCHAVRSKSGRREINIIEQEYEEDEGMCVMYEACAPNPTKGGGPVLMSPDRPSDPFQYKWSNCRVNQRPRALETQAAREDFRRICSSLYHELVEKNAAKGKRKKGDEAELKLCCSANQMEILKRDLGAAEAIVGSCASCYLNFRAMWCHMTCSPRQADFVVPYHTVANMPYTNFTAQWAAYLTNSNQEEEDEANSRDDGEDEESANDDAMGEEKENKAEKIDENAGADHFELDELFEEHNSTAAAAEDLNETNSKKNNKNNNNNNNNNSLEGEEETSINEIITGEAKEEEEQLLSEAMKKRLRRRKRRQAVDSKGSLGKNSEPGVREVHVVVGIQYYIDKQFIHDMIVSCRDVKLYGNDGLQSLCGVASKHCTPRHFGEYLGKEFIIVFASGCFCRVI